MTQPVAYLRGGDTGLCPPPRDVGKKCALPVIKCLMDYSTVSSKIVGEIVQYLIVLLQYYQILHNFTNNFRGNLSAWPPTGALPLDPAGGKPPDPHVSPPFQIPVYATGHIA